VVNSKNKGSLWENKLLKQLKNIDSMSHKTLGSGNSSDDKGDIACLHFLIEAKHHKTLSKGLLDKFWEKICKEADNIEKTPLLVYKENNKPPMVMMRFSGKLGMRCIMYWQEYYDLLEEVHCE